MFSSFYSYNGIPAGTTPQGVRVAFSPYNTSVAAFRETPASDPAAQEALLRSLGCFGTPSSSGPSLPENFDLTLIVTSDCNLRCRYCFAEGGDRPQHMSSAAATALIDGVLERTERPRVKISFFGGEPTLNMPLIREVVGHVERQAPRFGKRCFFYITTNGLVSPGPLQFMMDHEFTFVVSCDGAAAYQDSLRPRADGGPSSGKVEETLRFLRERDASFKVRSTISQHNAAAMSDNVRYFARLGVRTVHFEPVTHAGRGCGREAILRKADPGEFVRSFVRALDTAREVGVEIISASFMNFLAPARKFCDAMAGSRLIGSYQGDVSLCVEVQNGCHPYSPHAIVGHVAPEGGRLRMDEPRYAAELAAETDPLNPDCTECFTRYCCGGGCPVKNYYATGCGKVDPYRCRLNRELMADVLARIWRDTAAQASVLHEADGLTLYRMVIPDEVWMKRKTSRIKRVLSEAIVGV
jgi:uncharacterized protein